jgi:alginate O-acetyltransferase complex protein AlgI
MTVTTLSYLLFVLVVWIAALWLRAPKQRLVLFLVASYLFYASWGWDFLAILIVSSLMNWGLGKWLRRKPTPGRLWLGVGLNLLLLIVFKYLPPLVAGPFANPATSEFLHHIVMPVGISFWTFQALSYLFDVYREEEIDPTLLEFCLYLAFWPTVLAGPVCRLPNMLPQFRAPAEFKWTAIESGTKRILVGLFMKVVLAEILANGLNPGEGVAAGFDQMTQGWGGFDVWFLAIGYGFQLFFDFAGYSNIVIGTALLFGIQLEENFARPYFSTTPSVFWTRWHMSLSFWIRDYVFLPLASLKRAAWWRLAALVIAMTLFGLWHGASALFVIWGAYHGVLLVTHRKLQEFQRRLQLRLPEFTAIGTWALTFALVSLGWIFFRSNNLHQAGEMLAAVFSPASYRRFSLRPNFYLVTALVITGYFLYELLRVAFSRLSENLWSRRVAWLLSPAQHAALLFLIIVWSKQEAVFVYFQF